MRIKRYYIIKKSFPAQLFIKNQQILQFEKLKNEYLLRKKPLSSFSKASTKRKGEKTPVVPGCIVFITILVYKAKDMLWVLKIDQIQIHPVLRYKTSFLCKRH